MSEQLRFIAAVFKMAIKELLNVMGPESVQTIFRLIGEGQGDAIVRRLSLKYKTEDWTPDKFLDAFVTDVLEPALGKGEVDYKIENGEIFIDIKVCPFKRANMKIADKLYCTYTQGMVELAFKNALKDIEFTIGDCIADKRDTCGFRIKVKN